MGHAQKNKKQFFFLLEIIKADHQLSETFYFIKISYVWHTIKPGTPEHRTTERGTPAK